MPGLDAEFVYTRDKEPGSESIDYGLRGLQDLVHQVHLAQTGENQLDVAKLDRRLGSQLGSA